MRKSSQLDTYKQGLFSQLKFVLFYFTCFVKGEGFICFEVLLDIMCFHIVIYLYA